MILTSPSDTEYADLLAACAALSAPERDRIEKLLHSHGIASDFIEYSGNVAHIPFSDRVDVLQLKGVNLFSGSHLDTERLAKELHARVSDTWLTLLPEVVVLTSGGNDSVALRLPASTVAQRWHWRVLSEGGSEFVGEFYPQDLPEFDFTEIEGTHYSARLLTLPPVRSTSFNTRALLPGYHKLFVRCCDAPASPDSFKTDSFNSAPVLERAVPLIIAPPRCYEPDWVRAGDRVWGLSVQLYSVRSSRNWGIGDFSDLREMIALAARHRADFLVLNPLHALNVDAPEHCSPYSPNDRRRLNILYIDPALESDFCDNAALQKRVATGEWEKLLHTLRQCADIDYDGVAACKRAVLMQMFTHFLHEHLALGTERAADYERFVQAQGESLQVFAAFEAGRHLETGDVDPVTDDPRFTVYTQWLAETQLEGCQNLARELGMRLGLIRDLAVGGDGSGAEVSLNRELFRARASIGAPPDPLAPQGQNWGLPPLDPLQLQRSGYRHFSELLRTNMAHCGALRIDHVMALMRLWWCPRFPGRGGGAYVHYPAEDLFALLRLESVRNQCVVIGEDLGVVPPQVRQYLHESGVFSNVLFYFEKYDDFHFKRPEHYNARALAMVANHDVPTLAAWWNSADLILRQQLGLIATTKALEEQMLWRRSERRQVLQWLGEQWLLPSQWQGDCEDKVFDSQLCAAIIRCCARSSAQLLSVQLDDLALLEKPVNIPGTSSEYPNWRRKLPMDLQDLLASEAGNALLAGFTIERTPAPKRKEQEHEQ